MESSEEQNKNREKQHANLVRFKPGQSGNPGGRPKGRSLTAILRQALDGKELCGQEVPNGWTVGDLLINAMLKYAVKGDASLIKEAFNRTDGKIPDKIDLTGQQRIIVEYVDGGSHPIADPEATPGAAIDPSADGPFQCGELRETLGEDDPGSESTDPDCS